MKNDLTCGVVRDLLPSYVEGLLVRNPRRLWNGIWRAVRTALPDGTP